MDEKEEPEEKPEVDGKKSGFAEAADDTGVENYLGMERTVTASLNDAESYMRKSLEPILSATTFDEISDIINTRSLNLEDFKEHLARVMYVSGISGIASNRGEV